MRFALWPLFIATVSGVLLAGGKPESEPAKLQHPRGYVARKIETPPKIDGRLDDAAWKLAPWSEDFVDIEGDAKPKPRYRTRMKMLWDDKNLYIAAELEEPDVWASLSEHDAVIFQDPDFEVFLDPDGDNHLYGELELNAKNTTWDLLLTKPYRDGGKAINGWEIAGLKTAVAIDGTLNNPSDKDRGWTVEIAWPFAACQELTDFKCPPRLGDQWRINFSRVEWDTDVRDGKTVKKPKTPEHNWVWSPQGVINMHCPERWGYVQFAGAEKQLPAFRPDADAQIKDWLMTAYAAQAAYHAKNGRYAAKLGDLKLPAAATEPVLETTSRGYTLSAGARSKRFRVEHDSRLTRE